MDDCVGHLFGCDVDDLCLEYGELFILWASWAWCGDVSLTNDWRLICRIRQVRRRQRYKNDLMLGFMSLRCPSRYTSLALESVPCSLVDSLKRLEGRIFIDILFCLLSYSVSLSHSRTISVSRVSSPPHYHHHHHHQYSIELTCGFGIAVFLIFRFLVAFASSAFLTVGGGSIADMFINEHLALYVVALLFLPGFGILFW